ncbi:hypothetical protein PC129_g13316 [Phytophthora cactorum]|uniref:Uncharacterized protein n=1 Tax=Phytophthora cactorum TaxID=29920 RepID=A0A8T1HUY1_9STRA|nr:hypothetical protein PC111_g13254 [Phytophthora cactorum]KAG2895147.1 hypothetical protein PC114_g15601 [Phytophthora cactorum]KAG2907863.1 hypothetical protein PC115_g13739 [Phytophthora cactorum]KAG3014288.1 hypothetical protein PC119_g12214 [Phytophthora cactorum]KAG3215809.1 hypothetical protein PC129_g13316 [Phytophthora cactorum]
MVSSGAPGTLPYASPTCVPQAGYTAGFPGGQASFPLAGYGPYPGTRPEGTQQLERHQEEAWVLLTTLSWVILSSYDSRRK